MADSVSIAIIHDTAVENLTQHAQTISAQLGIAPPIMPDFNKPDYQQAMRLRELADWLARVNEAIGAQLQPLAIEGSSDATETQSAKSRRNR